MLRADNQEAKIIRFYSNITGKVEKPMDILTIEDLKAEGFVAYRYQGAKQADGRFETLRDETILVHSSVPIAKTKDTCHYSNYEHPTIRYTLGRGYEAKWGAVYFQLRNEVELWRFMRLFDYPISIDTKPTSDEQATH